MLGKIGIICFPFYGQFIGEKKIYARHIKLHFFVVYPYLSNVKRTHITCLPLGITTNQLILCL